MNTEKCSSEINQIRILQTALFMYFCTVAPAKRSAPAKGTKGERGIRGERAAL